MSEGTEAPAPSKVETPKQHTPSVSPKTSHTFSWLILVLLLGASAGGGYYGFAMWQQQQQHAANNAELLKQLSEQQDAITSLSSKVADSEAAAAQLKSTLEAILDKQNERNSSFSEELGTLRGSSRKDWLLAEAEYLLRLANQRILIESDPVASESLLTAADDVLGEINDPAFMQVRIKIAEEKLMLQGHSNTLLDSMLTRLSGAANAVDALNFEDQTSMKQNKAVVNAEEPPGQASISSSWWDRLYQKMAKAFSRAIRIERADEKRTAPPSASHAEYLKQNLALRIQQARIELMRQRFEAFHGTMDDALSWTKQNLPQSNQAVSALITELQNIANETPQKVEMDLSGSLNLLRSKLERKYRQNELSKQLSAEEKTSESAQ